LPKAHGNRNVAQMLLFLWDVVFIVINFFFTKTATPNIIKYCPIACYETTLPKSRLLGKD
jgi:hypothetical protein